MAFLPKSLSNTTDKYIDNNYNIPLPYYRQIPRYSHQTTISHYEQMMFQYDQQILPSWYKEMLPTSCEQIPRPTSCEQIPIQSHQQMVSNGKPFSSKIEDHVLILSSDCESILSNDEPISAESDYDEVSSQDQNNLIPLPDHDLIPANNYNHNIVTKLHQKYTLEGVFPLWEKINHTYNTIYLKSKDRFFHNRQLSRRFHHANSKIKKNQKILLDQHNKRNLDNFETNPKTDHQQKKIKLATIDEENMQDVSFSNPLGKYRAFSSTSRFEVLCAVAIEIYQKT